MKQDVAAVVSMTTLEPLLDLLEQNPVLFWKLLKRLRDRPAFGKIEIHFSDNHFAYIKTEETDR